MLLNLRIYNVANSWPTCCGATVTAGVVVMSSSVIGCLFDGKWHTAEDQNILVYQLFVKHSEWLEHLV